MARREPKRARPPAPADDWALFLDVDGCLLDIAAHPSGVAVPGRLRTTLQALAQRLDGALALVSGRSLAGVDALFAPLELPAAGLHGLEWRTPLGTREAPAPPPALATIHAEAAAIAADYPGAVVEHKGAALGLHWRGAPTAMEALCSFAEAALPRLPGFRLQHGHSVVELRPAAGDKGMAIAALMREPPFRDRTPVFAGDDITDESGFAVVNAQGGISILVGDREPSAAHFGLPSPAAVRRWLDAGSAA